MLNNVQFKINSIEFMAGGKHQQQFLRTFVTNINSDTLPKFQLLNQAIAEHSKHSPEETPSSITIPYIEGLIHVSSIGNPVKLPTATGESWDMDVACFVAEIEGMIAGAKRPFKYYVSGYTDRPWENKEGALFDPETILTINSIFEVRSYLTPNGTEKLIKGYQVLANPDYVGVDKPNMQRTRPMDVFARMSSVTDPMLNVAGVTTVDLRTTHVATPVFSDYEYVDMSSWLQTIVSTDVSATIQMESAGEVKNRHSMHYIETLRRFVMDRPVTQNPVMRALAMIKNGVAINNIKLDDLRVMDPNALNVCHINVTPQSNPDVQYESWGGSDAATVAASAIAHSVPAIMAKYGIRVVDFNGSNIYGQTGVNVIGTAGVDDFVKEEDIKAFEEEIENRVFSMLTHRNAINLTLVGRFDLFGNSQFTMEWDCEDARHYLVPTFANSLFPPVIAPDLSYLDHMAREIDTAFASLP